MRINIIAISGGVILALALSRAVAGPSDMDDLIVEHLPAQTGGFGSDTAFRDLIGNPFSQRIADDFLLDTSVVLGHLQWWGFYNDNTPPAQETFRIRIYGARVGDGLPDEVDIVFEQSVDSPTRTATGLGVAVGVGPDEYLFDVELASPTLLLAGTPYWLEVLQIGDLESHFRWEFSQSDLNGQAVNNPNVGDWFASSPALSDTAFRLFALPEPTTGSLLFVVGAVVLIRRKRGAIMN